MRLAQDFILITSAFGLLLLTRRSSGVQKLHSELFPNIGTNQVKQLTPQHGL